MTRLAFILLALPATLAFGDPEPCATMIASAFQAYAIRAEIAAAAAVSWNSGRRDAQISPLRGGEAPLLPIRTAKNGATHVLSLGSGGDVFRPMRDFPVADEIHLVDTLSGWGKSPAAVLIEVAARLKTLPGATVRVVQRGFTDGMKAEDLCSRTRFYDKLGPSPYRLTPFVWEVEWSSAAAPTMLRRRVSLHVMNYHDPDEFPPLLDRLRARGAIAGVMVTGAWEPRGVSQEAILQAMGFGGAYVFETTGDHFGAAAPGPSAAQLRLFDHLDYRWLPAPAMPERLRLTHHRVFVAVRR